MNYYKQSFGLAAAAMVLAPLAHAVTIDFNTASTDFTGNFAVNASAFVNWNATAGVNGGGGVLVSTNTANTSSTPFRGPNVYNVSTPNVASGDSFTVSSFFHKASGVVYGSGQKFFVVGLSTVSALGTSGGTLGTAASTNATFAITLQTNGSTTAGVTPGRLRFTGSTAGADVGGAATDAVTATAFSITDGNWYQLETVFTKTATVGVWTVSGGINNYGATGVAAPVSLVSFSNVSVSAAVSSVASTLYNAGNVFGGFSIGNGVGSGATALPGVDAVDNFAFNASAIPEPSTYAALAGLAALGLVVVRRRHNAG